MTTSINSRLFRIDSTRRSVIGKILDHVKRKLADESVVEDAISKLNEKHELFNWQPTIYSDLAITFAQLDKGAPEKSYDKIAHQYLVKALESQNLKTCGLNLFGGLCHLGLAALESSRNGKRYTSLLSGIDRILAERLPGLCEYLRSNSGRVHYLDYDHIEGLTGISAYLLMRVKVEPTVGDILGSALETLVSLANRNKHVSGFVTAKDVISGNPYHKGNCKEDFVNLGLAHGIPGPLSILSLSKSAGHSVQGIDEAISNLAGWIIDAAKTYDCPVLVEVNDAGEKIGCYSSNRASWCYGSPGVARALWLAGVAQNSEEFKSEAIRMMMQLANSANFDHGALGPIVCHGTAGLLLIFLRFYWDTKIEQFELAIDRLLDILIEQFDDTSLLGYCDIPLPEDKVDDPTILNGASGIFLVLHELIHDLKPTWDRLLLLS